MKPRRADKPEYEMTEEDWRTAHLVLKLFEDICRRGIQAVRKDARSALKTVEETVLV